MEAKTVLRYLRRRITGHASSEDPGNAVTGMITGVTSAAGTVTGTWAFDSLDTGFAAETDWSGFQLDVASPAPAATPECCSFLLFGTGLIGLALTIRKQSRQRRAARMASTAPAGPCPHRLTLPQGLVAQRS